MSHDVALLTEIRDLLLVMAEPALAKRDEKYRNTLRALVGKSKKGALAIMLMDGSKSQSAIVKEVGIDQGNLSRLIKNLARETLIAADDKHPKLLLKLPPNFFDDGATDE